MLNQDHDSPFVEIPYGSDHFYLVWPTYTGELPDYPDWRTYQPSPWLPAGINSAAFAGDELNGGGVNWPREVWGWDDIELSRPTVLLGPGNFDDVSGLAYENGQTVDAWIGREKRVLAIQRDHDKVKAAGRAGTIDERHPR